MNKPHAPVPPLQQSTINNQQSVAGKIARTVLGVFRGVGVIPQIRWLTHTGRDVPPSGLKTSSRKQA